MKGILEKVKDFVHEFLADLKEKNVQIKVKKSDTAERKKLIIGLSCLVAVYLAGVFCFSNLYPVRAKVNNVGIGMLSRSTAESRIESKISKEKFEVRYTDKYNDVVSLEEISSQIDSSAIYDSLDEVDSSFSPWLWFIQIFQSQSIVNEDIVSLDEGEIESALRFGNYCMDGRLWFNSTDATIVYNEESGKYEIKDGYHGNRPDIDKIAEHVSSCLITNDSNVLDIRDGGYYVEPDIGIDNERLIEGVNMLNEIVDMEISYYIEDTDERIVLDGLTMSKWIEEDEDGFPVYDEDVVEYRAERFVSEKLFNAFSTTSESHTFTSATGNEITVLGGTLYKFVDVEGEAKEIVKLISKRKSDENRYPVYKGYESFENGGVGDTFIEVDMTNQICYFVKNGKIKYQGSCITGTDSDEHSKTPEGCYYIREKSRNQTVANRQTNTTHFVNYWMPCTFDEKITLYDASWRDSFDSDSYIYDGTSGGIELPLDFAKKIYKQLDVGVPVICCYENFEGEDQNEQGEQEQE